MKLWHHAWSRWWPNVFSWVNKAYPVPPQVLVQRDGIVDGTNKSHHFTKNEQSKTILRWIKYEFTDDCSITYWTIYFLWFILTLTFTGYFYIFYLQTINNYYCNSFIYLFFLFSYTIMRHNLFKYRVLLRFNLFNVTLQPLIRGINAWFRPFGAHQSGVRDNWFYKNQLSLNRSVGPLKQIF